MVTGSFLAIVILTGLSVKEDRMHCKVLESYVYYEMTLVRHFTVLDNAGPIHRLRFDLVVGSMLGTNIQLSDRRFQRAIIDGITGYSENFGSRVSVSIVELSCM